MHSIIALDTTQSAASSPASPAEESVVRDPTDAFDGSSLSDEPTDDFDESFYSDEAAVTTPTSYSTHSQHRVNGLDDILRDVRRKIDDSSSTAELPFMPFRLLRITKSHVSLVEDERTPKKYAALSYCWGGPSSNTLRHETYRTFLADKPIQTLPRTIQDAIYVTQQLRIKYIWVDSLCILQDDDDDKITQIVQMADIYKGAQVTIAASSASRSTQGFLRGQKQFPIVDNPYNIEHKGQDPLDSRAWALQERLLSHRLLDFRSTGLHYHCDLFKKSSQSVQDEGGRERIYRWESVWYWHSIVEKFTICDLTVPHDKLPAIGGVAKEFHKKFNIGFEEKDYCAGLWKPSLPYDLLWKPNDTLRPRPLKERAPTWSWASIDGGVSFSLSARYYTFGRDLYGGQAIRTNPRIQLRDQRAKFGKVLPGGCSLHMSGPLARVKWIKEEGLATPQESKLIPGLVVLFDSIEDVGEDLYVFNIFDPLSIGMITHVVQSILPVGLLLTSADGIVFKRVGIYHGFEDKDNRAFTSLFRGQLYESTHVAVY